MLPKDLTDALEIMIEKLRQIIHSARFHVCLHGSAALDDLAIGFGDIDILILTDSPLEEYEAEQLVPLRTALGRRYPDNPCFPLFEGAILSKESFFNEEDTRVAYWGKNDMSGWLSSLGPAV